MEQALLTKQARQLAHSNESGLQPKVCSFASTGAQKVLETDQNLTNLSTITGSGNSQNLSFNIFKDIENDAKTNQMKACSISTDARFQFEKSREQIGALE